MDESIIISKRLYLRMLEVSDAHFVVSLLNQPDFKKHIGDRGVNSQDDARQYIKDKQLTYQAHGFCLMAVCLKESEQVIGMCGLLQRDNLAAPDIGYAYLPEYYRKGYGKEAAQAVLAHYAELPLVYALTSEGNVGSHRLLGSIGFEMVESSEHQQEGSLVFALKRS